MSTSTSAACAAAPRWRCATPVPDNRGRPINSGCATGAAATSGPRIHRRTATRRSPRRARHPDVADYDLDDEDEDLDEDEDDFDEDDEDPDEDDEEDEEVETWQVS